MGIDELVTDYLANPEFRPRTRAHYETVLRKLWLPWLADQGLGLEQVDQRALDRWVVHLQDDGGPRRKTLAADTVVSYGRAVNHFLGWARREGELHSSAKARPRRPDRKLLDVLTRHEIQRLEDAAINERDKLIVRVLADTGIRLEELLTLRGDSLRRRSTEHYLRVMGKGGKEREVPIAKALYARLKRYADRTRPADAPTERLFLGLRRRSNGEYAPLTSRGVQLMVKSAAEVAGIRKRVHPHLLRHSYATWQLRAGRNPISLKDDLGHTTLEMLTTVYAQLTPSDRHDEYMRILRAEEDDR